MTFEMEAKIFEGKTIDEAISKACEGLQVPREKLAIEIVAEATSGFLGFGAKKAVIRASLLQLDREIDSVINTAPDSERSSGAVPSPEGSSIKKPAGGKKYKKMKGEMPIITGVTKPVPEAFSTHATEAMQLLEGILARMGFSARVEGDETPDAIVLKIIGDKDGLIIGKKGQNLDAIQYIVNKAVRRSASDRKKIIIDSEEYRTRREESLRTTAIRAAEKVKKTKKPATLGPMNARDRRIIHLAIQNDKTLTTKSRGEGEYRKVVIMPAPLENTRQ